MIPMSEPRGCPTPGACSCIPAEPGDPLDRCPTCGAPAVYSATRNPPPVIPKLDRASQWRYAAPKHVGLELTIIEDSLTMLQQILAKPQSGERDRWLADAAEDIQRGVTFMRAALNSPEPETSSD